MIAIKYHATTGTHVRTHAERLLHRSATRGTRLRGVVWRHRENRNAMHDAIGFHPTEELVPARVMNGFGKMPVLDQIADLQVFVGNQIARCDKRVCRLS